MSYLPNYSDRWVSLVGGGNVVDNGVENEEEKTNLYVYNTHVYKYMYIHKNTYL